MIDNFDAVKKQLSELATVINTFKSEAVQLRIIELIFGEQRESESEVAESAASGRKSRPTKQSRGKSRQTSDSAKKGRTSAGSTGAVATLTQLGAGNFFDKPRTINDIIEHCKHNLARTFKANEFSGKLGRMVRTGELTRTKNADKQYEYKKP
jgi:hypothetical protein